MVDVDGYGPPRGTGLSRERAGGRYAADLFLQLPARGPVPLRFSIPSPSETKESGILCTLTY